MSNKTTKKITNFLDTLGRVVIGMVMAIIRNIHLAIKWLRQNRQPDKQQKTPRLRGVLSYLAGVTRKRKLRLLKFILAQLLKFVTIENQFLLKLWTRRVTIPLKRSLNFHLPTMGRALTTSHNLTYQPYSNRNVFGATFAKIK